MANVEEAGSIDPSAPDWERILKVVAWPIVALLFAAIFYQSIAKLIAKDGTELKIGPGGIAIISRSVAQAAEQRGGQVGQISDSAVDRAEEGARSAAANVDRIQNRSLLWVDDHPSNNALLQNAFAEAGVRVFIALDNQQAQLLLSQRKFDLAITDVGRDREGGAAGLSILPDFVRRKVPVIIYSGTWSGQHRGQESSYRGVMGITNDPTEVYSRAISILSGQAV